MERTGEDLDESGGREQGALFADSFQAQKSGHA